MYFTAKVIVNLTADSREDAARQVWEMIDQIETDDNIEVMGIERDWGLG